jgi:hypothetical protein
MDGACSTNGRDEKCIQNFGRKTLSEAGFWNTRHKRKSNIRMHLKEPGWNSVN